MREKILAAIETLNDTNYQASLDWYFILHDYAKDLARRNNLTLVQTAGIISALSPMIMFTTNLRDAERFCATRRIANLATYTSQRLKALRIIGAKSESEVLEILGGNKTKAFFLNILRPQDDTSVCLDTHMLRFFGFKSLTPKRYKEASWEVFKVSQELGLMPHQVQALLWTAQRGKAF